MEDYMDHQTSFETEQIRCECGKETPYENIERVCAGHVDNNPGASLDCKGMRVCNCCDECRQKCIDGAQEEDAKICSHCGGYDGDHLSFCQKYSS